MIKFDSNIIDGLSAGDERVYKELFDVSFRMLHQLASVYVLDEDVANDIVQEVYIAIYENAHLLKKVSDLNSYLRIAVRNRSFNYLRQLALEDRKLRLYYEEFVEMDEMEQENVEELLAQAKQILMELPDNCRRICEMRFLDGMKIKEIAQQLNLSENTVKVQLHRGVNKMRETILTKFSAAENDTKILYFAFLLLFL
ncbi:MAG: sigma-70 family RNA polymerase sigma factor [Dysgonamonadaceae bacterium]|jgi:RNA polymerase sigma-70 factor (ECF subfamily)|nr:sigma-70 family RNA polymerase sigma factor [Dysgonamonadaceae bacterium]